MEPYSNTDYEKENAQAISDRERHEESNFDEDAKELALAISLAISQASPVLTIRELALEITKGLFDWVGSQEDKLLELSRELANHTGLPVEVVNKTEGHE